MVDRPNTSALTGVDQGEAIFAALELSKSKWLMALQSPISDKISLHRIDGRDTDRLVALIQRSKDRAEKKLNRPVSVVSCYEAGYDGFWLHRFLEANDVRNHVIDPASIHVDRRARRAKTDRLDAETMVRVLMAFCRGERKVFSLVRVPDLEDEDARRSHRERERLVRERVAHVNRIKGILASQGVHGFAPVRKNWEQQLAALKTGDGRDLPPKLCAEVRRHCVRLHLVMDMIAEVEAERDVPVSKSELNSETGTAERKISMLMGLRGIGPAFASVLVREVFWRKFENRRQVGSYLGLAPSPYDSGGSRRSQGISKAGNPRARTAAIEMAWLWLRHQPDSELAQWYNSRGGSFTGSIRRITIIGLARKLVIALWRYLETGLIPTGVVFSK